MNAQNDTLRTRSEQKNTLRIVSVRNSSRLANDVQAFLLDAQARNVAPGTLRFYSQKLYPLITYLETLDLRHAEDVAASHLRLWLIYLQETGHNPGGVHGYYRAAKAFFAWLSIVRRTAVALPSLAHRPFSVSQKT